MKKEDEEGNSLFSQISQNKINCVERFRSNVLGFGDGRTKELPSTRPIHKSFAKARRHPPTRAFSTARNGSVIIAQAKAAVIILGHGSSACGGISLPRLIVT